MTDTAPTKFIGDLTITSSNAEMHSGLIEVTGWLDVCSDVTMDALTRVGGALHVEPRAKLNAPNLASVWGHPYPPPHSGRRRSEGPHLHENRK